MCNECRRRDRQPQDKLESPRRLRLLELAFAEQRQADRIAGADELRVQAADVAALQHQVVRHGTDGRRIEGPVDQRDLQVVGDLPGDLLLDPAPSGDAIG